LENKINKTGTSFGSITKLIETLRAENGCPWDKKQTPRSIILYLIEEAYELMDAIHSGNNQDISEELGDVLFLVLFLASMFQDSGCFTTEDLIRRNVEKMTRRHPHVFADATANTPEEVKQRWSQIKSEEKKGRTPSSILDSIPQTLPALMRSYRISERAARTGFDWNDLSGVMQKAEEEWNEFKNELAGNGDKNNTEARSMELGDVLFTLVNVGRLSKIHPEEALASSTKKFELRFKAMEKLAEENSRPLESLSFEEMHVLWDKVKKRILPG
jgi:tetrapyrrole methylase family protein/MazG family protein